MKSFKQYNEMVSQKQTDAMKQAVLDRTQDLKLKKKKDKKEEWDAAAIEVATDYLFESGLNEEGLDLLVEEIGLEDFVEFVLDPPEEELLMEERSARKAAASAPSYEKVKAKVDAGDKARKEAGKGEYAKTTAAKNKYGDEDNTVYDDDKTPAKKKPAAKAVAKVTKRSPAKKAEVSKKVTKAVPVAKKKQPAKKAEKKGLLNKVSSYVKKGVERHQKAVGDAKKTYTKYRAKGKVPEKRAKEFAKGVKSGVKDTVKFAGKVKKAVVGEAKVDTVKKLDDEGKEDARNYRRFGTKHNQHGHAVLRRALHRSDRGHKKIKGDKTQYVEKESVNLGEEEYDHYKDRHLEKYGSRPGEYDRPRPATGGGKHSGNDKMTKRKNSDKAVDNVVADLKKKYGDNAVLHSKRRYVAGKRVK